uniref:Uncharacterized protein n=1 Tax=Nelumbo nucifera TaxID=4432 RepID=A0A822XI49_NELNU|nr:TPA_asm: hypothetical protein HUJ06_021105 [Nelumbo nucifera]
MGVLRHQQLHHHHRLSAAVALALLFIASASATVLSSTRQLEISPGSDSFSTCNAELSKMGYSTNTKHRLCNILFPYLQGKGVVLGSNPVLPI